MGGYQIKVIIKNSRPPMWRRIFIPDCISFSGLHEIIQAAFQKSGRCLFRFEIPVHHQRIFDNSLLIDSYMKDKQFIDYTYILKGKTEFRIETEKLIPAYQNRFPEIIKYKGDFRADTRLEDLNLSMKENLCFLEDGTKEPSEILRKKQKTSCPLFLPIPSGMFIFSIQKTIFWRLPISISWTTVHRWKSLIWPHIFLNIS